MRTRYAVLLALVILATVGAGTAAATSHLATDVTADPADPNVSSTHTVTVAVGEVANGSSLSGVEIEFQPRFVESGGSVAGPAGSSDKVTRFGVDVDGDGLIERSASGSVSTNGGNARLLVQNTSGPGIEAGSDIIVEYTGADNPTTGDYQVNVTLNPQSASQTTTTTLAIGESSDDDPEPTYPTLPGAEGPAGDLDNDGMLEDADGDGDGDVFDAITYYEARNSPEVQNNPAYFDFDEDDEVGTLFDAIALYNDISS